MFVKTFLTCVFVLASCTSPQRGGSVSSQEKNDLNYAAKYETIAIERYKERIEYIFNESKTHVLCMKTSKPTTKMPKSTVSFFVFDLNSEKIVFEDAIADGSLRWINDRQLEIVQKTGTVSKKDPDRRQGYLFDLDTGKKLELSKNNVEIK